MDISKQVCTLEQGKRLKELGVAQVSLFHWWWLLKDPGEKGPHIAYQSKVISTGTLSNRQECCAYTVAELGEMLPDYLVVDGYYRMHPHFYKQEQHNSLALWTSTYGKSEDKDVPDFDAKNEAQSRAAMLIHLIESKLVTMEEVNKRLTH